MSEETNMGGGQDEDEKNSEGPPQLSENLADEIASMWEIPQMYQFLCLAKETLGIQHLSMYEMERMLLMPKASKQLASIMTSLLSPPMPKSKLRTMPPMPYQFWTNLLTQKALGWFKVYQSKDGDSVKVLETIGVEPEFWKLFPQAELISDRKFDKLSLRERVWLLKTVCDTLIHSRRSLQDEIVRNYLDDDSEMVLGKDRHGARYIYFPIFLDNDVRVYRHCLDNKILLSLKHEKKDTKPKAEVVSDKKMVKRKRKSWRYGKLPNKSRKRTAKSDKEKIELTEQEDKNDDGREVQVDDRKNIDEERKDEEKEEINEDDENHQDNALEGLKGDEKMDKDEQPNAEPPSSSQASDDSLVREEQETQPLREDVSSCSKTDDEKIHEKQIANSELSKNSAEMSKSDNEKIIETESPRGEGGKAEGCGDARKELEESTTSENNIGECISDTTHNADDINSPDMELNSDATRAASKREIEEFKRMITDLGESSFRLVSDSLDALRDLVACFIALNYPEGPGTVACELQLIKKLKSLIAKMEKIEATLSRSKIEAKEKLQEEWTKYQEGDKENGGQPADGEKGSNTWIIGSQGCPLLANGDTLSQSSMEGQPVAEGGVKIKIEKKDPDEENNGPERETARVLRRRGISSYMEPFFTSSEDSEPGDQDIESHSTPTTGAVSPPVEITAPRPRQIGEESTAEDSDQDWILPGSRKRQRKRSSPSKRNKSQHNKLQTINSHGSTTLHPATDSISTEAKTRINSLPNATPNRPVNKIKITSVHSELDIKDEGPIIDTIASGTPDNSSNSGVQQNYVLVNTGNGPVNYVVMPQDNPQHQPPMLSVVPPVQQQNYIQSYIPGPGGYIMPHVTQYRSPYPNPSNLQPMVIQGGQMMQQAYMQPPTTNYMQYHGMMPSMTVSYPGAMQGLGTQPGPRQPNRDLQIRAVGPQQIRPQHPVGAVIRSSSVPFRGAPRPVRNRMPLSTARIMPRGPRPAVRPQVALGRNVPPSVGKSTAKTTSLIVLSDSDDEIEMIITEKSVVKNMGQRTQGGKQKPVITSEVTVPGKSVLSPQIIQRMNQGGISITPIKPKAVEKPTIGGGTQLVVVVNETGSHYALALPNGSKLILTPEQVAQIRASNGGKLIL
ncbi:uncharacterized protein LOC135168264 [Diachasmimorpha longicaudata]|uniref:uncharacterized protein LOC135168264 n=1 Tax=Diachasmimorpha longicaudata TaxID=58733 RepID=UPI0030B881F8